jgi:autophagy-related protein 9
MLSEAGFNKSYFMLFFIQELRNKPSLVGLRHWSRYAHWEFREFNELPHDLEDRLNHASGPATNFINQFNSTSIVLLAK